MFGKINKDITAAMKAGDKVRLETLRMMKSKILNVNARGDLPEKDIVKILQNYAKILKESIDMMVQHGKAEEAEKVKKELLIVEEYVPKMLSQEETKVIAKEKIAELGITSPKEMGKIMKEVLNARADVDGALLKKAVLEILR